MALRLKVCGHSRAEWVVIDTEFRIALCRGCGAHRVVQAFEDHTLLWPWQHASEARPRAWDDTDIKAGSGRLRRAAPALLDALEGLARAFGPTFADWYAVADEEQVQALEAAEDAVSLARDGA